MRQFPGGKSLDSKKISQSSKNFIGFCEHFIEADIVHLIRREKLEVTLHLIGIQNSIQIVEKLGTNFPIQLVFHHKGEPLLLDPRTDGMKVVGIRPVNRVTKNPNNLHPG